MGNTKNTLGELKIGGFTGLPESPGIYRILSSYGSYIGQSKNLRARLREHAKRLGSKDHKNAKLMLVHDEEVDSLAAEVLELFPAGIHIQNLTHWLDAREAYWIEKHGGVLNLAPPNSRPFDAEKNALHSLEHRKEVAALRAELQRIEALLVSRKLEWQHNETVLNEKLEKLRLELAKQYESRSFFHQLTGAHSNEMKDLLKRIKDIEKAYPFDSGATRSCADIPPIRH